MALYAFDGTWQEDEEQPESDSNVVKFRDLYEGPVEYRSGVGTRLGFLGRSFGGLFGFGGRSRIEEMYDALKANWQRGDHTVDIIGFSRGAALAMHFSNILGRRGLRLSESETVHPQVRFLGVWDIVGAFGINVDFIINFQDRNLGWNIDQVPKNVEACFHAMALDERRETFRVTRPEADSEDSQFEETWFRGVHSDIGGGNRNTHRSNIALAWMLEKGRQQGLPIAAEAIKEVALECDPTAPISENKDPKKDERRRQKPGDRIHPSAKPRTLEPGQRASFQVRARYKFDWSGIRLEQGGDYLFSVEGGQVWQDGKITCGAEGWTSDQLGGLKKQLVRQFEKKRRLPEADWFELVGAIGDDKKHLFRIGKGGPQRQLHAAKTGDLYCFANDLSSRYGNNEGELMVTITRI